MDSHLDPVDQTTQYAPTDRVHAMSQSERDKERKFARALKEKLDDELKRDRRHPRQDSLDSDILKQEDAETESGEQTDAPDESVADTASDDVAEAKSDAVEKHVDIKA